LQISSYWREGAEIAVDLLPGTNALQALREARSAMASNRRTPSSPPCCRAVLAKVIADTSDYEAPWAGWRMPS